MRLSLIVAGNVSVEQGARNALFTAELCGSTVPVHVDASKPLLRELETAEWFHGLDGLSDHGYSPTPAPPNLATLSMPSSPPVTLTPASKSSPSAGANLYMTFLRDPSLATRISRCVIMGGNPCCEGNVTPSAKFKIWVDPEAVLIVFASGLPIQMIGGSSRATRPYSTRRISLASLL